ncbi:MAG: 16S rRNA (cytosine(1402)-N(4))-methyltransferase RsmH [Patescibacteria group bacterium]|nr:16S rRNA (cytosine(1402)-N(4))-methyltransferase RsmH [Patescibacteria group bacterium]MDE2438577.1 16S rRNA (cytosine(1402)-N(4))-methyltransferase RsmH [Patescibacteria group bacterium]
MAHTPVLLHEVLALLNPQPDDNYIDGTLGEGGHAREIVRMTAPHGRVLGIDWNESSYREFNRQEFNGKERIIAVQGNFKHMKEIAQRNKMENIAGVLLDLGWASGQLGEVQGLSFKEHDELLDMRFIKEGISARDVVNSQSEKELADIIYQYGEERYSRKIAKEIVAERTRHSLNTVEDLVRVVARAVPSRYERGRINPATRTFQALRIYVNHELENLEQGLHAAIDLVREGGRVAVISFHSLEDRIVKRIGKEEEKMGHVRILTKKPIRAGKEELRENMRARSAKLRGVEKVITIAQK